MNPHDTIPPEICQMIQDTKKITTGDTPYVWVLIDSRVPLRQLRSDATNEGYEDMVDSYAIGDLIPMFDESATIKMIRGVDKSMQYVVQLQYFTVQADLLSTAIGLAFYQQLL